MALKVGYVVTGYPYLSHTFVQREVEALQQLGVQVSTHALRRSPLSEVRSESDRRAYESTSWIRPVALGMFAFSHLSALVSRPRLYARSLGLALRTAGHDPQRILWALFYFAQAVVLFYQVKRRGARHIHAHFANVSSDLAMLAAALGGPGWSWSFTMHGPTEFADVSRYSLAAKITEADFVVCISDFCRSQLMCLVEESQWTKLQIVHCGLDTAAYAQEEKVRASARFEVLCVARLAAVKGLVVLLGAVQALLEQGVDMHLTIVGDGPDAERLHELAARLGLTEQVTFAGPVAQDFVKDYFAAADVFVLPSFSEGLPVVLMEAMASGLPTVTTRIAGIPELVVDGVTGFVVAPGRVDQIAEALNGLAENRDLRTRMGRAGQAGVAAEFDIHVTSRRLRDVFASHLT